MSKINQFMHRPKKSVKFLYNQREKRHSEDPPPCDSQGETRTTQVFYTNKESAQ